MSAVAVGVAVGAGTLGLGIYNATQGGPSVPGAPNVGQQASDQIMAQINATPANYASQATYNPKFAALNNTIAWQNMFGTPAATTPGQAKQTGYYDAQGNFLGPADQFGANNPLPAGSVLRNAGDYFTVQAPAAPGSLALQQATQPALLGMQTTQRATDINNVQTLGPQAYSAMRAYNPAVTGLYDSMDAQAQALVDTNGALDPFLQRSLQQQYRAGEAARGTAGGSSDAAMESYYQAATQEQRRLQNLGVAGQVAGQTAGYYGDPFQQVLSRTSGGVQVPGQAYTANQPSAVANTGSLLNGGLTASQMQGYQAQLQAQQAQYQSQTQGMNALASPQFANTLTSTLSGINNYFNSPTVAPVTGSYGAGPSGTFTTAANSYAPGTVQAIGGGSYF